MARLSSTSAAAVLLCLSNSAQAFTASQGSVSIRRDRFSMLPLGVSQLERVAERTESAAPAAAAVPEASLLNQQRKQKVLDEPDLWEYNFGLQDPRLSLPHGLVQDVSPPETYSVTAEQIQTLHQDGVVHIKGVFDEEWVEYLRKATAYQVDNPHFWAFAGTASKLYDYIQRNVWQTNKAFANFYYYSAIGDVLRQCGQTSEIRVSTDLLMVNPNKGFKWHQDNQNGPITPEEGVRFWITMDETPVGYGAPVYLQGSHRNTAVDPHSVFVDINQEGLEEYRDRQLEFRTKPGDMLIWHPKTIHKIDGPADGVWTSYRRVLGGTVAKAGTKYHDKRGTGGVLSDLGRHGMVDGDDLKSSFFPIIYPKFDRDEAAARDAGKVGRSFVDIVSKIGGMATAASGKKFASFFQVLGSRQD
jgi:ectoine hydroxylase-related dioxygenase (phytanoyl-CoA dioxygenase family)